MTPRSKNKKTKTRRGLPFAAAAGIAAAYNSSFDITGIESQLGLVLLAAGGILGLLGAWFAAGVHIRSLEPR